MNYDETYLLSNEVELSIIAIKHKTHNDKNCFDSMFSITVLCFGIAVGVNVPMIFLAKGEKVHERPRDNTLVTKYVLLEGSFVIPNKSAYMNDKSWKKVVKVVAPGNRKMVVKNVAFV